MKINVDPRLLVQYTNAAELVGIDEVRDEVIKILVERKEVCRQQDKIVSIVGFGGLGKTTLANAVYQKLVVEAANLDDESVSCRESHHRIHCHD